MNQQLVRDFEAPSSAYRGKPFWAWNGPLEEGELRRQIRILKRMGLGGFFMHSRIGLATPYLSEEWFRLVAACVDEAHRQKMEAWLYDEDRWPSGAAGGLVTKNPRYRMRRLVATEHRDARGFSWGPQIVAAFRAVPRDAFTLRSYERLPRGRRPAIGWGERLLVFTAETERCSTWYNGYTYLDTLNPAAVREFIRVTYQPYARRFGRHLGKLVPGIFTDEPYQGGMMVRLHPGDRWRLPWTPRLPAVFRERYGSDLISRLPEVLYNLEGLEMTPVRWQFHDCVTHLFVDSFARQIGAYCEKTGMALTGHLLSEDTLSSQSCMAGSCQRFYEHMQAPGMDLLTERWRLYNVAKQVSSSARQFGRRWRLSETYGCTGWDFNFAGHKALGDWQAALGINLRCQHLSWYTMLGEAKRDYPAGIFYQSPWWELYSKVEDYFGRIGAAMTRGAEVRDLLVVHPVESVWVEMRREWDKSPTVKRLNRQFQALTDALLGQHLDFDFGDEDIMQRHARVRREGGRAVIRLGRATYRAVLVPPARTLRGSTLNLLKDFRAAGGRVVFVGAPPTHVDATLSRDAIEFARGGPRAPLAGPAVARAVEDLCRRVSICDARGREIEAALYLLREDAKAFYLFVCNTGETPAQRRDIFREPRVCDRRETYPVVHIRGFAGCAGDPQDWDPETGARYRAAARRRRDGSWEITTSLPRLGSRLFVIPKARSARLPARPAARVVRRQTLQRAQWDVALSEPNVLVLDRPRYRIGADAWVSETEILQVDNAVRARLGLPKRGGAMVQPWARPRTAKPPHTPLRLEYAFDIATLPSGALWLALEQPNRFRVVLNGQPLTTEPDAGWWVDRSLRKVPLNPVWLRAGRNTLEMECDFDESLGLECVYLLGSFGVRLAGAWPVLSAPVMRLRIGDWVRQGLPFYSGHVAYRTVIRPKLQRGERLFLRVPEYRGTAVRVCINGRPAGVIAWEPNEVDVTGLLQPGANAVAVEVIGHRRNSHGPLHWHKKWPVWTGPAEYTLQPKKWREAYQLVPCGLMLPPELVVLR